MKTAHPSSAAIRSTLAFLALAAAVLPAGAQQQGGVYTVAKLSVDVQAKDAVTAKTRALDQARLQALHTVFRRVGPFNGFARMPELKAEAVDDLLDGFSFRREKNSATRYLATLDFNFNRQAVRKLLTEKGVPVSDKQGDPVTVLPVYVDKGEIDHTGRDPWRTAWNGLDLEHAIVPVRLGRAAPSFSMESLSSVMGGDVDAFVALRDRHKGERVVLAVAEAEADGASLTTRLYGIDPVGSVSLTRHDAIPAGGLNAAAEHAAGVALGVLEGRWKLARHQAAGGVSDAPAAKVDLVVEYRGMGEWREIRERLLEVPGVQGLDVKSLSARGAQVAFQFPGGAERLAQALAPHGLSLHGGEGTWVLRGK